MSVDSFSSDSNNYSPNNGSQSQAESGFEDDFSLDQTITNQRDPWDAFDMITTTNTSQPQQSMTIGVSVKPKIAQKPINIGQNSSFFVQSGLTVAGNGGNGKSNYDIDPLCNGKNLINPTPVAHPTIIRPKTSPTHTNKSTTITTLYSSSSSSSKKVFNLMDELSVTPPSPPSPPMPNCPPPPPPVEYFEEEQTTFGNDPVDLENDDIDEDSESYGLALYDFEGTQDSDLSFRVSSEVVK